VHQYTDIYHRLLNHRQQEQLKILEIGVGGYGAPLCGGASIRMWAEYFPKSRIVGIDIAPKTGAFDTRIKIYEGSQADVEFLQWVSEKEGPFDIVIDDGSHRSGDVLSSFETLLPLLSKAGVYFVEDVQTAFWPEFDGNLAGSGTIISRSAELVTALHSLEIRARGQIPTHISFSEIVESVQFYRNLIVITRGMNDYPSNHAFDLSHASVQASLKFLEIKSETSGTDGPFVLRATMFRWAHAFRDALTMVRDGLTAFPHSAELLWLGYVLSKDLALTKDGDEYLERLRQLTPFDARRTGRQ
jgi:demethylmacrocin O-methyltransferase